MTDVSAFIFLNISFMHGFYYVYIILVGVCLLRSVIRKDILTLYFSVVLLVDLYMFFFYKQIGFNVHPYAIIFYCCYFIYYYRSLAAKPGVSYGLIFLILCLGLGLVFSSENPYSIPLIMMLSVVYIVIPLLWFFNEIMSGNDQKITDKQKFWTSTAMLFWIVFFIFKMIPLYFFDSNDPDFLRVLDNIYQVATIISYLIFYKSLYHR